MSLYSYSKMMILVLFSLMCFVQKGKTQIDSLLEVVKTMSDSEEKAAVYKDIAFSYYFSDPDKCLAYCDTILAISKKVGYQKGINSQYYLKAVAYYIKEDYEASIDNCKKAIERYRTTDNQDNELIALDFLGTVYRTIGLPEKSVEYKLQSLEMAEIMGDTLGIAYANYNLSTVFFDLGDTVNIKKHLLAAIDIANNTEEYSLLSNCYSTYATIQKESTEKLLALQQALGYAEKAGSDYFLIPIFQNLASYYFQEKQWEEAINYSKRAYRLSKAFEDSHSLAESANTLGNLYKNSGVLDSALFFLNQAVDISNSNGFKIELEDSYYFLAELYQKRNNSSEALKYLSLAYTVRDSVYNDKITEQIQTNAAKFEYEKNQRIISEQELAISKAKYNRNVLLFVALLLLAVVTSIYQWYLRRQQKQKQRAELAFAQQQAEADRLRELDELKTNFFTNISHELRTPLTLILSPLADIQNQVKAIPIREKLGVIRTNAQRLLGLVNEIMDLAKVEAGKLELQQSKIDLQALVKRNVFSFESLAQIRRVQLELDYAPGAITVFTDRNKLEKIIQNLISNAIKYTRAGGRVNVRVQQEEEQFTFEVEDTGQGISPSDLSRVFDRFYQVKQGSLQGGTGVGLALARELAELMGGTLTASSIVGKGSIFTLNIPMQVLSPSQQEEVLKQEVKEIVEDSKKSYDTVFAPITIAGEKPRLLIVEDNPDMGKYLVQILEGQYQCVLATDGEEAIKQLKNGRFDCITSDVMMPNMDGFELRAAINQNKDWKQIPFLLLTARYLEADKIKGFQLGIDDYVTKPFSTLELQARIQNLVANKLEREAFAKNEGKEREELRSSVGEQFVRQAEQAVLSSLGDPHFEVADLAKAVNYSSKQLARLLKKYTGLSSVNFILEVRLQKARELLEKRLCTTVTQAQIEVGISSNSYFTRKFTERFGKNPSAFL